MDQTRTYVSIPAAPFVTQVQLNRFASIFDRAAGGNYMDEVVEIGVNSHVKAKPKDVFVFGMNVTGDDAEELMALGAEVTNLPPQGYQMTRRFRPGP